MRRIKLIEVLMTIPVAADGDDWDLEIEDELFEIFWLAEQAVSKACGELRELAAEAEQERPCSITITTHPDWDNASLEELRARPMRTRERH